MERISAGRRDAPGACGASGWDCGDLWASSRVAWSWSRSTAFAMSPMRPATDVAGEAERGGVWGLAGAGLSRGAKTVSEGERRARDFSGFRAAWAAPVAAKRAPDQPEQKRS